MIYTEKMKKSVLIMILMATAVLLTASCRRIDPLGQTSDVDLVFSAEGLGTKADDSATLQDGGKFKNLFVILATGNDTDGYSVKYCDYREFESPGVSEGIARFRNVVNGSYQVFAFANLSFEGTYWDSKTTGEEKAGVLASNANLLSEGTDGKLILNGDDTAVIASGVASLLDSTGAMLLTGRGTVTISGSTVTAMGFKLFDETTKKSGLFEVSGKIMLHRPFVKLTVEVHSPVGHTIRFDQLSFSAFKPDKAYLLNRATGAVPEIPDGVNYSEINVATSSLPAPAWEGGTDNKLIYSTYLFENDVDDNYIMYGHVIMDEGVEGKKQDLYLGLGEAPENPDPEDPPFKGNGAVLQQLDHITQKASPVAYMRRNQAFNVIINVYYGSSEGDIDFSVEAWTEGKGDSHVFK